MSKSYDGREYKTIKIWAEDQIGYLQFNRPETMNALDRDCCWESVTVVQEFQADPDIRVIILCGHENVFAAGADIKALMELSAFEARDFLDLYHKCIFTLVESYKPIIAAANGLILGGGMEIMLASDLRIIGDKATLGLPEMQLGIHPGGSGTQLLPRETNLCLAKEYILTGDFFNAAEAYRMGIVNRVVAPEDVMPTAIKLAKRLTRKSPMAMREAKNAINLSQDVNFRAGCRIEQVGWSLLFSGQDQKEGMHAFYENRKPNFQGK